MPEGRTILLDAHGVQRAPSTTPQRSINDPSETSSAELSRHKEVASAQRSLAPLRQSARTPLVNELREGCRRRQSAFGPPARSGKTTRRWRSLSGPLSPRAIEPKSTMRPGAAPPPKSRPRRQPTATAAMSCPTATALPRAHLRPRPGHQPQPRRFRAGRQLSPGGPRAALAVHRPHRRGRARHYPLLPVRPLLRERFPVTELIWPNPGADRSRLRLRRHVCAAGAKRGGCGRCGQSKWSGPQLVAAVLDVARQLP